MLKIYTTFEDTLQYLPSDKADFVGATVREDLKTGNKNRGYQLTKFNDNKKILLVMGGSLGSKKLNDIIRQNLDALLESYQVIHLTGKGLLDEKLIDKEGYTQFEFVKDDLTDLLAITDTVISRAGSNAIYEFLALRIPMLLIPLGLDQSRGDQIDNAKNFESKGFGRTIPEDTLTEQQLMEQLNDIEMNRDAIVEQMQTYKESYTRQDLFHKIIKDSQQ